jgi:hypothetical protein
MFFVFRFPDHHDFIYRDVTGFAVTVFQMQYALLDFQNLTAQARRSSAVDIYLLAQKLS